MVLWSISKTGEQEEREDDVVWTERHKNIMEKGFSPATTVLLSKKTRELKEPEKANPLVSMVLWSK